MRNLMLSLVVLGGVAAFGGAAGAAPVAIAPASLDAALDAGPMQTVQYGPGWRAREDWRRRQAWRHHRWERRHGYYAGRGYPGGRGYPYR